MDEYSHNVMLSYSATEHSSWNELQWNAKIWMNLIIELSKQKVKAKRLHRVWPHFFIIVPKL